MVDSKKLKLEVEIEVDVPLDIVEDKKRIKAVEDGLGQSISKGLYEQGVSFKVKKLLPKWNDIKNNVMLIQFLLSIIKHLIYTKRYFIA
jgi:hypothetical protein